MQVMLREWQRYIYGWTESRDLQCLHSENEENFTKTYSWKCHSSGSPHHKVITVQ